MPTLPVDQSAVTSSLPSTVVKPRALPFSQSITALGASASAEPIVRNTIMTGNTAQIGAQLALEQLFEGDPPAHLSVSYSNIEGGLEGVYINGGPDGADGSEVDWGPGNIDADSMSWRSKPTELKV